MLSTKKVVLFGLRQRAANGSFLNLHVSSLGFDDVLWWGSKRTTAVETIEHNCWLILVL
jgi:hypothetical protein